jgi:hypothetical protein
MMETKVKKGTMKKKGYAPATQIAKLAGSPQGSPETCEEPAPLRNLRDAQTDHGSPLKHPPARRNPFLLGILYGSTVNVSF